MRQLCLMELRIQECSYFGEIKKKEILKIASVSRFIYVQGKKEKTLKSKKFKYCKHQYLRKANFFFVIF